MIISLYAFKVYRNTGQKFAKYFGYGFLLISLAYIVELLSNYLVYSRLDATICTIANLSSTATIDAIGTYAYMLFMISGLVVLLFVSLKSDKQRTLWIILLASLIAIGFSNNEIYVFYLLSSIYLAFIAWHFIENYIKNRQTITLTVALAFIFLGFGAFHFLISVNHELFYVIGTILEFFAYIMILMNWYLVKK